MSDIANTLIQSFSLIAVLKLVYTTGRILQKVDSRLDEHEKRLNRIEERI